jgi:hypothetical protein
MNGLRTAENRQWATIFRRVFRSETVWGDAMTQKVGWATFHAVSNKYGECALTLQSRKLPEKTRGIPSSRGRLINARPV